VKPVHVRATGWERGKPRHKKGVEGETVESRGSKLLYFT
jgi:hypothetical protein